MDVEKTIKKVTAIEDEYITFKVAHILNSNLVGGQEARETMEPRSGYRRPLAFFYEARG